MGNAQEKTSALAAPMNPKKVAAGGRTELSNDGARAAAVGAAAQRGAEVGTHQCH